MQRMDKLRRSLRDSFRKKRERDGPESSKPHQWQADEEAVRSGNCPFGVRYLGCVEVYESRGMQVCEEAMKVLRQSRRRPVRATLFISGDGLRVVEDDTKGLIVDQTIEKVSFCAPDRNHERGFSYICRDGTTRRWMCHGFLASKESGERLSHAVGCAFAVCLERKQKREKDCGVSMTFDSKSSAFTRSGSFRVDSMSEIKSAGSPPDGGTPSSRGPLNTHAIERPHAPPKMLERQNSFRGFTQLANRSPFKRQLSLRLNELPSNIQRTQQSSIDLLTNNNIKLDNSGSTSPEGPSIDFSSPVSPPNNSSPLPPPRAQRSRLQSLPTGSLGNSAIPEFSAVNGSTTRQIIAKMRMENKDLVSELCQQVTQGLSMLAANHDDIKGESDEKNNEMSPKPRNKEPNKAEICTKFTNPWDAEVGTQRSSNQNSALPIINTAALKSFGKPFTSAASTDNKKADTWLNNLTSSHSPKPVAPSKLNTEAPLNIVEDKDYSDSPSINEKTTEKIQNEKIEKPNIAAEEIKPVNTAVQSLRGSSVGSRGMPLRSQSLGADPFDADWATSAAKTGQASTNPFVRQQTFQVSM